MFMVGCCERFGSSFREKSTKTRIETFPKDIATAKSSSVLEKNPPKQGLKLFKTGRSAEEYFVLEKNPPKQGLKLLGSLRKNSGKKCFREKSTKTRIETKVLIVGVLLFKSFREKSTKTRIETSKPRISLPPLWKVLEKNPPKQGLKQTMSVP